MAIGKPVDLPESLGGAPSAPTLDDQLQERISAVIAKCDDEQKKEVLALLVASCSKFGLPP